MLQNMIKIFHTEGSYAPVIVCDVCKKRIEKSPEGVALAGIESTDIGVLNLGELAQLSDIGDPEESDVFHVHKGDCMATLEKSLRSAGKTNGGHGLDQHLYYIARNLGLNLDDLRTVEEEP